MENKNPEENLTYEDVAKEIDPDGNLGITKNTVMRMIKEGLPVTEITPNNRVIKRKHLDAYLESKKKSTAKQDIIPEKKDETETTNNDVTSLKIEKEKAEIQVGINRANVEIAELQLKQKLTEQNIKSIEDIKTIRETLQKDQQILSEERIKVTTQQDIIDGLKNDYNALLNTLNTTIAHQEAVTKEANDKLALANTKLDNYEKLIERKCTDCLRRDKNKCTKCSYKIFCDTKKINDYKKWAKKNQHS